MPERKRGEFMSELNVAILQIRDTSFNIGFEMGKHIQSQPILKTLEMITKPEIDYENMKSIYSAFAPHLFDELQGLSEALEISPEKAAALFSGYDVPKTEAMGCSTIITKEYYVRNYDFSPVLYDRCLSLLQPESTFSSVGYNLQVIGRHDGVNNHGLVLGLHFVSNNDYSQGLSAWTSIRMILDTCSSLDDAVHMLKEIPHSACYNFSIGDRKGNMAVVEASPETVIVRRGQALLSCVNHFQDQGLEKKNRPVIDGSIKRNKYLQDFQDRQLTHDEMFSTFANKNSPVFFTDYDQFFGTLHTFSYSFQDSRILTAIARSNQVLEFHFDEWVAGNNIDQQSLTGRIEST